MRGRERRREKEGEEKEERERECGERKLGEREERRGERKRKKGKRETRLATEKFPSPERGALEREERKAKERGITSGKRERTWERGRVKEGESWREKKEREKKTEGGELLLATEIISVARGITRVRTKEKGREK